MPRPFALKMPGLPVVLSTNTKGGVGKTLTVQALAVAAKLAGFKVCVLDIDPIGSVYNWKSRRKFTRGMARGQERYGRTPTDEELAALMDEPEPLDEITVSPTQPHALGDALKIIKASGKDFAFIDTAGSTQNYADQAAEVSDLVLIPSKPVTKELEHLPGTLKQLALAGFPPRFCLFNRVHPAVTTGLEQARRIVREHYNTTPLPIHFTTWKVWDTADDMGLGPQELEPDSVTAGEAQRIFSFICDFMDVKRSEHGDNEHARTAASRRQPEATA